MGGFAESPEERVEAISTRLARGLMGRARAWGGADIVICATPPAVATAQSFYPDPRYVVTPYVQELSWLFGALRDAFTGSMNHLSKYEFYGRLADAAEKFARDNASPHTAAELIAGVLGEVRVLAAEAQSHSGPSNGDCCQ